MPNRGNLNKYIKVATFKTRMPNRGHLNKFKNGGNVPSERNTTGGGNLLQLPKNIGYLFNVSKLHNFLSQQQNWIRLVDF